ncbi:cupin domain-containing protein [Paraburkholderia nemoris]|uniref:cupin domain-containing protein n=1 Tax=Paraburkholderia nemoris TaxID=2793076 RepID=UPI0038BDFEE8
MQLLSMTPRIFKSPQPADFSAFSPVPQPVGQPVTQTRSTSESVPAPGMQVGIWEATPGVWHRQVTKREYSYFIEGHCFFTPYDGEPIEIKAGDSVFFPENSLGIWDIREVTRKAYLIMD